MQIYIYPVKAMGSVYIYGLYSVSQGGTMLPRDQVLITPPTDLGKGRGRSDLDPPEVEKDVVVGGRGRSGGSGGFSMCLSLVTPTGVGTQSS